MKHLSNFLISLFILGIGLSGLKSQDLLIRMNNGTEYIKPLSTIQNITFPANTLLLQYLSGATEPYTLMDVRSLHFDTGPLTIKEISLSENSQALSVYPNPTNHSINIQNIPDGIINVKIYNIYGILILKTQLTSGNKTINISELASGLYIININNHSLKFNKI